MTATSDSGPEAALSGPARRTARAFIAFRILFNCRFYYPVYAVFFLDLGLTVSQFAILNAVWAATIVLLEVPSGALADLLGRKKLVVAAAVLMVLELAVLCFTPAHSGWTFPLFMINRVLSGTAEAMASGADEAMAYEALPESNRAALWKRINAVLIKWQSIAFVATSIVGSLLYDQAMVNGGLAALGMSLQVDKEFTLRIPVVLTLLLGFGAVAASLGFVDVQKREAVCHPLAAARETLRGTLEAAGWIRRTPAALSLLLLGLFFDSFIRLFYTVASPFYRLIHIPDAFFGFVGAAAALTGIASASLGERILGRHSADRAFALVGVFCLIGAVGIAFPIPWFGLLLVAPLWLAMRLMHYFLGFHLNEITPSSRRATVLSFRGLSMNLAYGGITLAYGGLSDWFGRRLPPTSPGADRTLEVFAAAGPAWPTWLAGMGLLLVFAIRSLCAGPLDPALKHARLVANPPAPTTDP